MAWKRETTKRQKHVFSFAFTCTDFPMSNPPRTVAQASASKRCNPAAASVGVVSTGSFRAYRWNSGTWSLNQKNGDGSSKIDKGTYPM
jgi:hypothetical protein